MKITNSRVLRASIKRILITIALIVTLVLIIGFLTISYVVGNSMVEAKEKPLSYPQESITLLLLKFDSFKKNNRPNHEVHNKHE
ncbi:hypothetical protein [Bacillus sp. AFS041924]|uniref:hypothetical protein n=1 Tax=Bacillus sp. AFS041924 TaxID=2033503 RepID=UPI000BFB4DA6|nr:hypothetical protein [Bacillus sp. AFS041924]PGS48614.1 hypothetical protein COC46_17405 [Bacillus sp. AFS041924]